MALIFVLFGDFGIISNIDCFWKRFSEKYEKAPSGIHGGWIIDHKKNSLENPNPMQPNMITRNLQKSIHIFNRNDIILKKNSKKIENNF